MKKLARTSLTIGRRALGYGLLGGALTLVLTAIVALERRPDLHRWHKVHLDEEFDRHSGVDDFAGYLALEERLFAQLEREVFEKTGPAPERSLNRYQRGSLMDPAKWTEDWNRTFEWKASEPRAGVLLLHGMSDSPYSLRHMGQAFHQKGATVVGLRIPGHGTAPSGLIRTRWQDMAAAVRLAMQHLAKTVGDNPLYIVGYSNGGALAVVYALEGLRDPELPKVDGLVLLSPAIGVTPAARFAVWQGRLGRWLGFDKLAWNAIGLEYDPFKYRSFAVNAGDQSYRISQEIERRIHEAAEAGQLATFPPVLAYQSGVDATVSTPALVSRLFARLPENGHELVIFDLNRLASIEHVLADDPADELTDLITKSQRRYTVNVLTNQTVDGRILPDVEIRRYPVGAIRPEVSETTFRWPPNMFSLSHIALPFPESDTLYGSGEAREKETLGNLALRGERGAIRIPPGDMLRQRWNPFYALLEHQALAFCGLTDPVPHESIQKPSTVPADVTP